MKSFIFISAAYITGILAAVPAGPVQIEVVRRTINGHLRSSFMVIVGAMIADIAYGVVAFFGIAPFLETERTRMMFDIAGAAFLVILGITIVRQNSGELTHGKESQFLRKKRWGLISGFSLSAVNPMMIIWWLIGAQIFMNFRLIDSLSSDVALAFLAAGGLGLASYLVFLSLFLYWARRFISQNTIRRINFVFSITLLAIAAYFLYSSALYLMNN